MQRVCAVIAAAACGGGALGAGPWASQVVSYGAGQGVQPGYDVPGSALGEPTRFTGVGSFPGAVTPFNPAFLGSEIVSIGTGGHLVLKFDTPVADDPLNPFGVDFLVFGNTGYIDSAFPAGVVGGVFGAGNGVIEVSADGVQWVTVGASAADRPFPTMGYLDLSDPYSTVPGSVLSDFTRPVDPGLDPGGMSFAHLVSAYDGSGGGTGVDLWLLGLPSISYVRVSNSALGVTVEIDALADVAPVPGPGAGLAVAVLASLAARRRRGCRP